MDISAVIAKKHWTFKAFDCLRLRCVPIKRLPNSLTSLKRLQILDLYKSSIRQLPSRIHRLSSLKILDISQCEELHCIPRGISKLTALEVLWFEAVYSPVNDLKALKHLKNLSLFNNGETVQHGTLGNMIDMEKLYLRLTMMENLPQDITAMSKLRCLTLHCPNLTRVEHSISRFEQLSSLALSGCKELKEICDLHKLVNLKLLRFMDCPEIEELPKEFGERGAFPKLELFCLTRLDKLEEFPQVDEAAMPLLKTLVIAGCESLKMLAEGYWNLKSVKKIGIYGCPMALRNLLDKGNVMQRNSAVQTITMSSADMKAFWAKYDKVLHGDLDMHWCEVLADDFYQTILNTSYS